MSVVAKLWLIWIVFGMNGYKILKASERKSASQASCLVRRQVLFEMTPRVFAEYLREISQRTAKTRRETKYSVWTYAKSHGVFSAKVRGGEFLFAEWTRKNCIFLGLICKWKAYNTRKTQRINIREQWQWKTLTQSIKYAAKPVLIWVLFYWRSFDEQEAHRPHLLTWVNSCV